MVFWVAFIVRSGFRVDGVRYFSLFDDAMISMRYARNLAAGDGLVWNAGERVEGYTNLLWTLWMAVIHGVGVPERYTALAIMLTGVVLLAANLVAIVQVARRLFDGDHRRIALVVVLVGSYYPLVYWTLRGMEVGLLALLTTSAVALSMSLRADPAGGWRLAALAGLLGVGVLVRTDFVVVAGAVILHAALTGRDHVRAAVALGGTVSLVLVGHSAFRLAYYGELLPNTYHLKLGEASHLLRIEAGLLALSKVGAIHLGLALLLAAYYIVAVRRRDPDAQLLGGIFALLSLYSVYVGGDAWEVMGFANRYLTTASPLLLTLAVGGAVRLLRERLRWLVAGLVVIVGVRIGAMIISRVAPSGAVWPSGSEVLALVPVAAALVAVLWLRRRQPVVASDLTFVLAGALLFLSLNVTPISDWWRDGVHGVTDEARMVRYGLLIREHTQPHATVAVTWAGAPAYFSHRPAVDLLGKNDPVIARGPLRHEGLGTGPLSPRFHPGHMKWDYRYSIGELRPDLVADMWRVTEGDCRLLERAGYEPLGGSAFHLADADAVDAGALERAIRTELGWHKSVC